MFGLTLGDDPFSLAAARIDDLVAFLRGLDPEVPVMALGLGSNLIVRDGGVPGVVVRLGKPFATIQHLNETKRTIRFYSTGLRYRQLMDEFKQEAYGL